MTLCSFGLHRWNFRTRDLPCNAGFPAPWEPNTWVRTCLRCGKRQRWLPGYGGQEWGSWEATTKGEP